METFVVRVWLPDRPGALGQVASCIGAAGGDVVGIEILERGGGSAIDELTVSVPDRGMIDAVIVRIGQVEGVAVEDVRPIAPDRPDHGTAALELAVSVVEDNHADVSLALCIGLRELVDGDWAVTLAHDETVLATVGNAPDTAWLAAFVSGSAHLSPVDLTTPGDVAWAHLPQLGAAVIAGRAGRVFHTRERHQLHLLARIVDASQR